MFHPDSIKDNPYIPPVVITSFKRYNTDEAEGIAIEEKGISQKKEIELSYKNNILTFEFAALSYCKTFKNQYAYKLEGYSDKWIQLGTERRINFTNLDPDTYTLRVKGSNNDGVWNEKGTSLKIIITPPWWKTWWAYTLYTVLFMSLLYGLRRYELNRIRLKNQVKIEHMEAEKMKEVDHLKSRFFANISHEFRTPLTLILGPLENLLQNAVPEKLKEQYEIMQRNGRRLLQLINQLLDLAKLEAGSMALRAKPENIVHLLKLIIASFQSLAERKRVALRFHAQDDSASSSEFEIPPVYVDRDKFEKIISNLLANAVKFTPEGGEVSVQLSVISKPSPHDQLPTDHCLLITVKDTGIGIPANELDKIFDRFYQVDRHRHEYQGTGIGLALTKELVKLHGGEIYAQSEVDKGSTFVVRLRLGKAHLKLENIVEDSDQSSAISDQLSVTSEAKGEERGNEERQATEGPHPATIDTQQAASRSEAELPSLRDDEQPILLIVEDNADMRKYLREILEQDYRLMEAGDGEEGLRQASAAVPDLIVSDVMMPKMDGFEFCHRIKTKELTSHIPVILLTARAAREDKLEGLDTGVDDYVTKPFDADELRARVRNLIEQRRRLRERFSREITLQPKDIAITTYDERFLSRAMEIVEKHISNPDFSTETFAKQMGVSRMQLNRKLRALTDQATGEFVRSMRLKRAAQLLANKGGTTIVEIAYEVGFSSPAYFAKCFREQFGLSPSEYVRRANKQGSSA
jgi:signal transduction histidine kinase/DNA-binding response OmpR family regulator